MEVLLIHNPGAGGGNLSSDEIISLFRRSGHRIRYRDTHRHEFSAADAPDQDAVVVAGGDGTVDKAVRRLAGFRGPFALLPLGRLNNLATCLGVYAAPEDFARDLATFAPRPLDVGCAEGPWGRRRFLEGAGLGALADMIAEGKARKMEGEERRQFDREAPVRFVRGAPVRNWSVEVDGAPLPPELIMVEMLNIPVVGPRLRLARESRPGDGLLDVVSASPDHRGALTDWAGTDRTEPPGVLRHVRGRRLSLTWRGGALRIGDKMFDHPGGEARVEISVEPEPLEVLVPQDRRTS